jgi:hypothetical protein
MLRHRQSVPGNGEGWWFIPTVKRGKIGSCFMQILDGQVRHKAETDDAFGLRLCQMQAVGDGEDTAKSLCRAFRLYRAGESTATGGRVMQILRCCPDDPDLRAKLVLARAIDRNMQDAIKEFGAPPAIKLIKYFGLSFEHFRHLLRRLDAELSKDDQQAWNALQSQTFTGNTPFEAEHYYPLTEPYVNGLARRISTELERLGRSAGLSAIPTTKSELHKGKFASLNYQVLPLLYRS